MLINYLAGPVLVAAVVGMMAPSTDAVAMRATIDSIRFVGNHALSERQLRDEIPIHHGDSLNIIELERDLDHVLDVYDNSGYPFAEITIDTLTFSQARGVAFTLKFNDGSLVTIRDVESAAKIDTKQDVLRRASGLEMNTPYRQQRIDRIKKNLEKLEIFSSVGEPLIRMQSPHDAIIAVPLEESNTTIFDAIIGFLPATSTSSGYFVGSVDVAFLNLFASARKLGFHWQRKEVASQDLWVTYHEPWIFSLPVAMDIRIEQHEQDSTFTRRQGTLGASTSLGEGFTATGLLTASSTSPGSPASAITHSSEYDAGIELLYDTRDDPYSARRGVAYSSRYTAGTKSTTTGPVAIQHVDVFAELNMSVAAQSVGVLSLHAATVASSALDAGDLLRVGGVGSIRGYRDQQFYSTRLAWGTVEFHQLIGRRSFLFAFSDAGYVVRSATVDQPTAQQDLLLGYGVGIQTDSPLGLMKVSFALGKGDSFGQAKIHFGVVNRF